MIVGSFRRCTIGERGDWFTNILQQRAIGQPCIVLRESNYAEWEAYMRSEGHDIPWYSLSHVQLNVPYFYEISTD